ncbi:hypothetical protein SHIRM173S_05349 [Streptomyces hirsutus]
MREAGADIHRADHSASSIRPVSHQDGSLHGETAPSASQTRTDQWYRVRGSSRGPS